MQVNVLGEDDLFELGGALRRFGGPKLHQLLMIAGVVFNNFPVAFDLVCLERAQEAKNGVIVRGIQVCN
jgi:hypothetical protein